MEKNVIDDIRLTAAPTTCRNKGSGCQQEQVSAMDMVSFSPSDNQPCEVLIVIPIVGEETEAQELGDVASKFVGFYKLWNWAEFDYKAC